MEYFIAAVVWVVLGVIGMSMAEKRNRSKTGGFFLGFFLGLIGLCIIALMGNNVQSE